MPLVTFNYSRSASGDDTTQLGAVLDDFTQSVQLPREAYNKRWWLRSVSATRSEDGDNNSVDRFRWVDIKFPELMSDERVLYSLNGEGSTPEPNKSLRFYVNKYSMDQVRFHPSFLLVDAKPNLNLGTHRLDTLTLSMKISAVSGYDNEKLGLWKYSVILEYE
jgi:hypothetical protein